MVRDQRSYFTKCRRNMRLCSDLFTDLVFYFLCFVTHNELISWNAFNWQVPPFGVMSHMFFLVISTIFCTSNCFVVIIQPDSVLHGTTRFNWFNWIFSFISYIDGFSYGACKKSYIFCCWHSNLTHVFLSMVIFNCMVNQKVKCLILIYAFSNSLMHIH